MTDDSLFSTMDRLAGQMRFAERLSDIEQRHHSEVERLLTGCLEIVDALEALETRGAAGKQRDPATPRTVGLIRRRLLLLLKEHGVQPMKCDSLHVDLDLHEIESARQDSRIPEDHVLEELRRGYLWNGALLRRARVVVSSGHADGAICEKQVLEQMIGGSE